jgi:hypothetical protein
MNRSYNFNIAQVTSGVGILSVLPSGAVTITGAKGGAGQDGSCPIARVDFYVFGGTAPYSVVSPLSGFAVIAAPGIVSTNGGSFTAQILGCGKTSFIVTDATGRTIETSTVEGVQGAKGDAVTTVPFSISPISFSIACGSTGTISLTGTGTFSANVASGGSAFVVNPTSDTLPKSVSVVAGSGSVTPAKVMFTSNGVPLTATISLTGTVGMSCP